MVGQLQLTVDHSPAPTKQSLLPWNLLYSESTQTPTEFILPSTYLLTASHYARHSHHATLEFPRQSISSTSSNVFIQWVPGNSNISGNGLANRAAKEATTVASDTIHSTPMSCAFQVIDEFFHDHLPSHVQTSKIYQHPKASTNLQ